MKTPITYYGGKMNMVKDILPLIPEHEIYTEPFLGGGAIFWSKEPSKLEVLNDSNGHVTNFYVVLQNNYKELKKLVDSTLHSRLTYKYALCIYNLPRLFSPLQQAWAFWVLTSQGFSGIIGSWSFDKLGKRNRLIAAKKQRFTQELVHRLESVQIECDDALKVITSRDTSDTFHYIDPPYVGAAQGHYGGYTEEHFRDLLNVLSHVKGKFILSSYQSELLDEYVEKNGWYSRVYIKVKTAEKSKGTRKKKVEVLTANFDLITQTC